jgi:2-polyprenyl-3-methyl-5-hydroxy-6-metoxy-1,4-benzoquinol methylase
VGRPRPVRIVDVGAGNGAFGGHLAARGFKVTAIDSSLDAVEQSRKAHPDIESFHGSVYDELSLTHGTFPIVTCVEVIEHCFFPRRAARCLYSLLDPGGTALISTPYHGYWKNLALAASGHLDAHFTALWDYGHIKFWSTATITELLREAGFVEILISRIGRIAPLAKSMIVSARRPQGERAQQSL